MTQGPDESLEDFEERFQLSYKRANYTLDPRINKYSITLRGERRVDGDPQNVV